MDIKVKIQNQDKILECLSAVFDIVQGIKRTEDSSVVLDLSDIHIPSPVFTLPLSILLPDKSAELTYVLSDALKAANRGISTKNLPNAENRGYGLVTSKKMLTTGLGGLFIMISGSAILIKSETFNEYAELPEGLTCEGTIVICRMPFDNKDFNYINYIE